jgi:transcriptional regulator with GAF, ATPase, and Fis domain
MSERESDSDRLPATVDQHRLAERMAVLAHELLAVDDRERTLDEIVKQSVDALPEADGAGIALIEGSKITTAAPTGAVSTRLHELQVELGEGPCLTSLREQHTVIVDDLAHDRRWPRLAARAEDLGVHSTLSFQLYVEGDNLGALDLYAQQSNAFDQQSALIGDLFARHASVAIAQAGQVQHLNYALVNRDVIGQAKGILMQRDGLDAQQAFNLLVRVSQETNLKLTAVARWLVDETEQAAKDSQT